MANSVDPDQTATIGAVCSGSTLFASILNSSVMLDNYSQQTTSADNISRVFFFLVALRVKTLSLLVTIHGRFLHTYNPYKQFRPRSKLPGYYHLDM